MILKEERLTLNGHEILLRSAKPDDAPMLKDYLKTVSGETRFLSKEADEVTITDEQEAAFIEKMTVNMRETVPLTLRVKAGETPTAPD